MPTPARPCAQFDFTGLTAGDHTLYGRIIDKDDGFTQYTVIVHVSPKTASMTPDAGQHKTYGSADPTTLTGTTSGFLPDDGVTATFSRAAGETAGVYAVYAALAPIDVLSNYDITYDAEQFTIDRKAASVTPDAGQHKTYGSADPTTLTGTTSGFLPGDGVTATFSRATGETTGVYAVYAALAPVDVLSNYDVAYNTEQFTIDRKAASVTPDAGQHKTYGDADPTTLTGTTSGFLPGDGVTATFSRAAGETVLDGPYTIEAVLAPLDVLSNYDVTYNTAQFTIDRKAASVMPTDGQHKTYGSPNPTLTATGTGFVNGDTVAGLPTQPTLSTTATVSSAVGTYDITVSGPTLDGNYSLTYVNGTLSVTPALLTITADTKSKLYGAANPTLTATGIGFMNGDTLASLPTQPTLSTTATVASGVGTYPITVSGPAVEGNYSITYANGTLTVTPAPLKITADNKTKRYGTANPTFTATGTGFVRYDTLASLPVQPTFSTTATTASPVGTYAITATGPAVDGNYAVTYVGGTLTVAPASLTSLTITAANLTKAYGAPMPTLTYTGTGFKIGDSLGSLPTKPTLWTTATAASGVGRYPIFISGPAVDGNYAVTYVGGTLTVTPGTLTATANSQTMVYGAASLPSLTYSLAGLVNGDTAGTVVVTPPTLTTTAKVGSHVGSYVITIGGGALNTNSQGLSNYTITYVSNYLKVTPASLTITADNKYMLAGSAVPALTCGYAGWVNGDTVASLTRMPTVTTTATSVSPARSYPITVSGAVDSDYSFLYRAGTLTVEPTNNAGYLMPDPLVTTSPTQYILYIWGTTGNNTITVNPGSGGSLVSVTVTGVTKGYGSSTQPISRIVAHGVGGSDTITVSGSVTLPAWLYGDSGTVDIFTGGGGPTYLFGGAGQNTLTGGSGRSILIGGAGHGTLTSGTGDAILIGGTTTYNPATLIDTTKDAALLAILNEWKSTTHSYPTRVGYITGSSGTSGANGSYYLKAGSTVLNNGAVDTLVSNPNAYDLFFKSARDTISGTQKAGDQTFSI